MSTRRSAHFTQVLHQRAACMRAQPTTSEAALWQALRGSRLGVGFRRQHVVGRFIADFAAPRVRLIVEVDGGYHVGRAGLDARRERQLGKLGWRVVRVSHAAVLSQFAEVVSVVRAAVVAAAAG